MMQPVLWKILDKVVGFLFKKAEDKSSAMKQLEEIITSNEKRYMENADLSDSYERLKAKRKRP